MRLRRVSKRTRAWATSKSLGRKCKTYNFYMSNLARPKRPRRCRPADQRDELAPFHCPFPDGLASIAHSRPCVRCGQCAPMCRMTNVPDSAWPATCQITCMLLTKGAFRFPIIQSNHLRVKSALRVRVGNVPEGDLFLWPCAGSQDSRMLPVICAYGWADVTAHLNSK
jgi:hypothetical protein